LVEAWQASGLTGRPIVGGCGTVRSVCIPGVNGWGIQSKWWAMDHLRKERRCLRRTHDRGHPGGAGLGIRIPILAIGACLAHGELNRRPGERARAKQRRVRRTQAPRFSRTSTSPRCSAARPLGKSTLCSSRIFLPPGVSRSKWPSSSAGNIPGRSQAMSGSSQRPSAMVGPGVGIRTMIGSTRLWKWRPRKGPWEKLTGFG